MTTTFKDMITKHIRTLDVDAMNKLADKIDWMVDEVRKKDPSLADRFMTKIDLLVNPHFTRESAEYAVSYMKNRDGTAGQKWSYDDTTNVMKSKGYDFDPADWYYVLNMMYSDYFKPEKQTETYIEDAMMFLSDTDAPKDKAKRYFLAMHC